MAESVEITDSPEFELPLDVVAYELAPDEVADDVESNVELPPDVDELQQGHTLSMCSCKLACHSRFSQLDMEDVWFQRLRLSATERDQKKFALVLQQLQDQAGSVKDGQVKWHLKR